MKIAGVILAGGKGTRMDGANKSLLMLGDEPLVTHVFKRLAPQVDLLGINANRDLESFLNIVFHLTIVPDGIGKSLGPLDGILGAMIFAKENSYSHVLTVSVDTPFIPLDLAEKLITSAGNQIAVAASNGKTHGTCALWPISQIEALRTFILSGKNLKVMDYLSECGFVSVPFVGTDPDPFLNINTPHELEAAARWR
jgi:molybdenum cofactor guanylyltransferase